MSDRQRSIKDVVPLRTAQDLTDTEMYRNAMATIESMRAKHSTLASYPFKLFVEPTQRCDLDCIMCSKSRHKSRVDMSMTLFRSIEREFFPRVAEVNFFIGGEATLAENFTDMIATVDRYHFVPKIFSNCAHVPAAIMERFAEHGFFVNISLESVDKKIYERFRRGSDFDMFRKNLDVLLNAQRVRRHPRSHVRLACTCSPYNIDGIIDIVKFAREHGIRDVFFNNCDRNVFERHFYLGGIESKAVMIFMEAKACADAHQIRFSCPKKIGNTVIPRAHNWHDFALPIDAYTFDFLEKYNPYEGRCPHPWIQTLIRTDGTVMACCQGYLKMGKYIGGSFMPVWNNRKYQQLRARGSYAHCGLSLGRWRCNLAHTSIWESDNA